MNKKAGIENMQPLVKNLRRGDVSIISESVGCSEDMVRRVLRGDRNADTVLGKRIIEEVKRISRINKENNLV